MFLSVSSSMVDLDQIQSCIRSDQIRLGEIIYDECFVKFSIRRMPDLSIVCARVIVLDLLVGDVTCISVFIPLEGS